MSKIQTSPHPAGADHDHVHDEDSHREPDNHADQVDDSQEMRQTKNTRATRHPISAMAVRKIFRFPGSDLQMHVGTEVSAVGG